MVARQMGGSCNHLQLSERYNKASADLRGKNNSLVMPIGDLTVGASRHRALLLKWLADACDLPCRLVRGDFYLGDPPTLRLPSPFRHQMPVILQIAQEWQVSSIIVKVF